MKLNEYIEKARTTALYPNLGNNLYYPTLGLAGECAEVVEKCNREDVETAEIVKELGDVMWYVANLTVEYSMTLDPIMNWTYVDSENLDYVIADTIDTMVINAGKVCEASKKIMRDSEGEIPDAKFDMVYDALNMIVTNVAMLANILDTSIEEVMQTNIDKLLSRKERGQLKGDGDNR